ncbi:MAG: GTP pyrophosphokinase family protein [Clostridia bacterium]|nr:GTP pyrophosphokinase family protein [Clostridia bacterium]
MTYKKEEIIISIVNYESELTVNGLVPIRVKDQEFNVLMSIYEKASNQVLEVLKGVQSEYKTRFSGNIVNYFETRIKEPKSILNKMNKKELELNYRNMIDSINDIAGVRAVCNTKNDIYSLVSIIENVPNWNLIKEKDYIKNPKKSGYSAYHVIVEVPVRIYEDNDLLKNQIFVKVEIQLRTMAMDFWATHEHKMKYKAENKVSFWDSKRLEIYAKLLNVMEERFSNISKKREKCI